MNDFKWIENALSYTKNSEIGVDSINHNLTNFFKIHTSKMICKSINIQFDARKDYWWCIERKILVFYLDRVFRNKYIEPETIRAISFRLCEFIKEIRVEGFLRSYPITSEGYQDGITRISELSEILIEFASKKSWDIDDTKLLSALDLDEYRSFKEHFIDFLKTEVEDTDEEPSFEVSLSRRIRLFPYLTCENYNDLKDHFLYWTCWYQMLTSTNAYQHGGAQAFGPVIGNEKTQDLLEYVDNWSKGTPIEEMPFMSLGSFDFEKIDRSHTTPVSELYSFCNLENNIIINKAVINEYLKIFPDLNNSNYLLSSTISKEVKRFLKNSNTSFQQDVWESFISTGENRIQLTLNLEFLKGKKLNKAFPGVEQNFIDKYCHDEFIKEFNAIKGNYSKEQVSQIITHLACDFYARFKNEVESEKNISPIEPKVANESGSVIKFPLNQIYYGPPGTGKTYGAITEALKIIEGKEFHGTRFEAIERFKNYESQGLIRMVTFHQSYSYEDFIEGIRPITNSKGQIEYKIVSGLLKSFLDSTEKKLPAVGETLKSARKEYTVKKANNDIILLDPVDDRSVIGIPTDVIWQIVDLINKGTLTLEEVTSQKNQGVKEYIDFDKYILGYRAEVNAIVKYIIENKSVKSMHKNKVLVIDEINRGNISKIFGELITLLEENKREGAVDGVPVKLQYSGDSFILPKCLYLIGTMNTADRSIAMMDIALRRRFQFKEVSPKSNLVVETVGKVKFREIFDNINEKISICIGRDYQIGHSYFMKNKINNLEDLKDAWFDNLIPLLNEYFHEEWDKLQLFLGDFITSKKVEGLSNINLPDNRVYRFLTKEEVSENFERFLVNLHPKNKNEETKAA